LFIKLACQYFELQAPPSKQRSSIIDFGSFLYPQTIYLQLVSKNGQVQIIERQEKLFEVQYFALNMVDLSLPRISLKEIQVLQPLRRKDIMKVLIKLQERCCKIASNVTRQAVQRELDCLSKVSSSTYGSFIQVPKLVGLVHMSRGGPVIGIIEDYI
jgi:hypothetical protein